MQIEYERPILGQNMGTMSKTMTSFKPGEGGRPKGVRNKISRERQEKIDEILSIADDMVEEALRKLKPKELLDIWVGLTEYVCPKLQRVTLDTEPEDNKITKIIFEIVPPGLPGEGIETKSE